ncbi:mitochondrial transcription termination factor 3 [Oratosquilla oratoria]|uniref:mitochondrial transcription termination factor 3 n=1 Tax=Oratosquilla oratoria TaxID=337810 RepID=UPI003F764D27
MNNLCKLMQSTLPRCRARNILAFKQYQTFGHGSPMNSHCVWCTTSTDFKNIFRKNKTGTSGGSYFQNAYLLKSFSVEHNDHNHFTNYVDNDDATQEQKVSTELNKFNNKSKEKSFVVNENSISVMEEPNLNLGPEGDWSSEMAWIMEQEDRNPLAPPKFMEDIDDVAPELRPTFNLAAYVNKSPTLQKLVELGVDISTWDKRQGISSLILKLEFEKDIQPYLMFLIDVGVPVEKLGRWLTINPLIFTQPLDDLEVRLNYLISKKFSEKSIKRIIERNPYWLMFSTVRIDTRLGFFQETFSLSPDELRQLATKESKLITYNLYHVKNVNFSVLEEMGFTDNEMKRLLLKIPKLWLSHGVSLMRRFDFLHNKMGITHDQLSQYPQVLRTRDMRLKQRHGFLMHLGRSQYDPTKVGYVSMHALISGTDVEFCKDVAKCSVHEYNEYLLTL